MTTSTFPDHWTPPAGALRPEDLNARLQAILGDSEGGASPSSEHAGLPGMGRPGLDLPGLDLSATLRLILSVTDLTTLEATDTPGKVRALCRTALRPVPGSEDAPAVAAVCVYPTLAGVAAESLKGTGVQVASVAGAFPSGMSPLHLRVEEVRYAVGEGATEIDAVLPRGVFLDGEWNRVHDEIAAVKEACGAAPLKLILETGELSDPAAIYSASAIALDAGSDFIKTSTGKIQPAATPMAFLAMLHALRSHRDRTGLMRGIKASGGIRTWQQAVEYLRVAQEVLGVGGSWADWSADWFRFGASSLVADTAARLQAGAHTAETKGGAQ